MAAAGCTLPLCSAVWHQFCHLHFLVFPKQKITFRYRTVPARTVGCRRGGDRSGLNSGCMMWLGMGLASSALQHCSTADGDAAAWWPVTVSRDWWQLYCSASSCSAASLHSVCGHAQRCGHKYMLKIKRVFQKYTLWSYQLLQKHLLIYSTKMHLNDFHATPLPSSHIDIWYLVAYNPEICQISWEKVPRKKVRYLDIYPHSDA